MTTGFLPWRSKMPNRCQLQQCGEDLVRNASKTKSTFLLFLGRAWFSGLIIIAVVN